MSKVQMAPRTSRRGPARAAKRIALLSSAALVSIAGSLTFADPASAAVVTGVVRYELQSPDDAATAKSVTVTCPAGKKVINAGGYIANGNGKVAMDDIYPNETLDSVKVSGKETDAYGTAWRIHAFATCADEPAGLEWIWAQSEEDTDGVKSVTAECSPGKTLLGTGGTLVGGEGEAVIDEIKPNGGPGVAATQVTVEAAEADDFIGDWTVNALAICADPLDGQQVVSAETTPASLNTGTRADCSSGQAATGSGAELVGPAGRVVIDDSYPTDGSTTVAPTATTVYGQEEDGTTANWHIRAFAICADV